MADWALLPNDLVNLILNKLVSFSDYLRFGSVCKSWLVVATSQKDCRIGELHRQIPMLLVPTQNRSRSRRSLYSVTNNKIYHNYQLPIPYSTRCSGSSHGWLVFSEHDLSINLFNPFSGKTIHLPPVADRDKVYARSSLPHQYNVRKVVFSSDPSLNPNDYVVVAIYSYLGLLAYMKPVEDKDKGWRYIAADMKNNLRPFKDAIYHKGCIYAIDDYCGLLAIDYSNDSTRVVVPRSSHDYSNEVYIVESSDRDQLLMVRRFHTRINTYGFKITDCDGKRATSKFLIYRLQEVLSISSAGNNGAELHSLEWVEIDDIGKDAIFLGDNHSMSVMALNFPGCQPNCIYYTDDDIHGGFPNFRPHGHDNNGIYHLKDQSFGVHYKLKPRLKRMPPPIWVLPSM